MTKKALIVTSDNPYPERGERLVSLVVGGFEKLILDYERCVFDEYDVYVLVWQEMGKVQLTHYGEPVSPSNLAETLLKERFEFAYFVDPDLNFEDADLILPILRSAPCFCFVQYHPNLRISDAPFKGMVTHFSRSPQNNVLILGGSYDPRTFYPRRQKEEYIVCTGRIAPEKNQLELVRGYKERIHSRYGLPLYLVGGCDVRSARDRHYFDEVSPYIDRDSVHCSADPEQPSALHSWRTSEEIAELCNRSRMFVIGSPVESFCIALLEAMACGTTCVVNGKFYGFEVGDLQPHVFGNITGARGTILDVLERALEQNIRIDASDWTKKFSLGEIRQKLMPFIRARLDRQNEPVDFVARRIEGAQV